MVETHFVTFVPTVLSFAAVFLLTLSFGQVIANWWLKRIASGKVRQAGHEQYEKSRARLKEARAASIRASLVFRSLSHLALPEGGWQDNATRLKFLRAGLRQERTGQIYFSLKALLAIAPPALAVLLMGVLGMDLGIAKKALIVLALAAAGYYAPDAYLRWRRISRQEEMRRVLPDLIDLLVVCTEAGLALDQAISRVSREIQRSSRALAEEFHLVTLEVRVGAGRTSALRNLALRTDVPEIQSMVSMLIQADRFGTSIADALRIQSETSRVKRMQHAEEIAAKIPTKMLLPLVLLIFPALMMVLLGPAVLQMLKAFSH